MKVRVVYNQQSEKYRVAYKPNWHSRWRWAKRIVVSTAISEVSLVRYQENHEEIAEFDAIGQAEEFVAKWIAPRDDWYDPRDDQWTLEAEVEIPGKKKYTTPEVEAEDAEA